jgi:hypothetical protein
VIILSKGTKLTELDKILKEIAGTWKDHPIFRKKTTKEIIEMLRGPE